MKLVQTRGGKPIYVNSSDVLAEPVQGKVLPPEVGKIIAELQALEAERRGRGGNCSNTDEVDLADALLDVSGECCLSPILFTRRAGHGIGYAAASHIAATTMLGKSIIDTLSDHGLLTFIERQQHGENKRTYRRCLDLFVASLTMCTSGLDDIAEMPVEAYLAWLSYYRNDGNTRWRSELWPKNHAVFYQAVRELSKAFSSYSGDHKVAFHTTNLRETSNGARTWTVLRNAPNETERLWLPYYSDWIESLGASNGDRREMFRWLMAWVQTIARESDPLELLLNSDRKHSFAEHLTNGYEDVSYRKVNAVSLARRFSSFLEEKLEHKLQSLPFRPLVRDAELERVKRKLDLKHRHKKTFEVKSTPLPPRLYKYLLEILEEGERGWLGQSGLFHESVLVKGRIEHVYCPVIPAVFHAMTMLPLRTVQYRRLDSGEGDVDRFNGELLTWEGNTGPLAGYWLRKNGKADSSRGYATRFPNADVPITGFWINTNKRGGPYTVPWMHADLHALLWKVRLWVETFVPIPGPITPEHYLDKNPEEMDSQEVAVYPDIFPLFRLPWQNHTGRSGQPPSYRAVNQAWQDLMSEVQRKWNADNADKQIEIVRKNKETGQNEGAIYNPHGLRVRRITEMYTSGIPIEVISKLVAGHATVLQTIMYLKFEPSQVSKVLEAAEVTKRALQAESFMEEISELSLEEARRKSACLREDGLVAAVGAPPSSSALFVNVEIGMCPWGGTRCHDGGPCLRKNVSSDGRDKSTYGYVEGGKRNCVLCRHFITGPAWGIQLALHHAELIVRHRRLLEEGEILRQEIDELLVTRNATRDADERERLYADIMARETMVVEKCLQEEIVAKSIYEAARLVELCEDIQKDAKQGTVEKGTALIVQMPSATGILPEMTEFEECAVLTEASRVYPLLHNEATEARRDAWLDRVLYDDGQRPISFRPIGEKQRRHFQDALARMLLERLERAELDVLTTGKLRLQDLNPATHMLSSQLGKHSDREVPATSERRR